MGFKRIASSNDSKNSDLSKEIEDVIVSFFPMEGTSRKLYISNIKTEVKSGGYSDIKKAISGKSSVLAPVSATLTLKDLSGKVLDKSTKIIARIPVFTKKNSFIIDGTSYNVISQQRLKSGIYTYERENGNVYSTVRPSNGREFKISLDNSDRIVFSTSSNSFSGSDILGGFNISQRELLDIAGKKISLANMIRSNMDSFNKFKEFVYYDTEENLKVDKDVMLSTLGIKSGSIGKKEILLSIGKLIKVTKDTDQSDEPTNMIYKKIRTSTNLIAEQYKKNLRDTIYSLKFKLNNASTNKVDDLFSTSTILTKPLKNVVVMSKLSRIPDEYNPINSAMYNHFITPMGEGGIGDTRALSLDHKSIHGSQLGFIDPIVSPEGANVGITLAVTENAYVSDDGEPAISVINTKTGKAEIKELKFLWEKKVAYPETGKSNKDGLYARVKNKDIKIKRISDADYIIPSPESMHSPSSNFIPLLNSVDANRTNMAQKHIQQALPLVDPDIPNVGVSRSDGSTTGESVSQESGSSIKSKVSGIVEKIDNNFIYIKTKDSTEKVELADNVPFSTKTFLTHKVVVKVGEHVKKGTLLADSNFSKNGSMAIGKNLTVAWLSMPGNRNDGVIISESAASKLTSEHIYKDSIDISSGDILDLAKAFVLFPSIKEKIDSSRYGRNGVIKKGEILKKGDPIAVVISKNTTREIKSKLTESVSRPFRLTITTWKKSDNGEVLESTVNSGVIVVESKVRSKAKVGDKLSARAGNKGVISKILPDEEMPKRENGEALDVTLTSAGVVTRINPGVLEEGALGMISEKKGGKINIGHYALSDNLTEIKKSFGDTFGKQKETLINPETGKPFPSKIFVGKPYMIKLFKDSEGATSGVGIGSTDQNEQAAKGGKESASSISNMEVNALLAHGANGILSEVRDIKGKKNDALFEAFLSGSQILPKNNSSYSMDRFTALLEQLNVSVEKDSSNLKFSTKLIGDKDVLSSSNGEVKNRDTIDIKTKTGSKGGLFDDRIFGGISGTHKGHINLKRKVLNPMHEEEIASLLGIGKEKILHEIGEGRTSEIISKVKSINIEDKISSLSSKIETSDSFDGMNRDIKLLKFLKNVKTSGKNIYDVSFISAIPVMPPKYRPVSIDNREIKLDGINMLYQDILDIADETKRGKTSGELDKDMYLSIGALYGTHKSPNESIDSDSVKGVLDILKGTTPKQSFAQKFLTRKKQFMSGRGVIRPARTDISIDEIELPENIAYKIFKPHIQKSLLAKGMSIDEIDDDIDKKGDISKSALIDSAKNFPVYYTRSPALWKHNILGANAKIVKGDTIGLNPLVERSLNADYDGDQIAVYATMTRKAGEDVRTKLFPSNHLLNEDKISFDPDLLVMPDQDTTLGFYKASISSSKKSVKVSSVIELNRMLKSGEINYNDKIII